MRELGIIQDSQGKLVIEKKKEKFAGYEPNMNSKRFEKNKDLDDPHGIITFPQNTLKKPKTKGQQIKKEKLEREDKPKKGEKLLVVKSEKPEKTYQRENFEKLPPKAKTESASKNKDKGSKDKKFKGYNEYLDLATVEERLAKGELFQVYSSSILSKFREPLSETKET